MKSPDNPDVHPAECKTVTDWEAVCRRLADLRRRTDGNARCRAILARLKYLPHPRAALPTWNRAKPSRTKHP